MASVTTEQQQKPKRTPIVLNMHLLYKEGDRKYKKELVKETKEVKPAAKVVPNKTIAKPAVVKPAELKPAEVKPAEVKPAEVKPAEVKPAEVKPAEVKPAEVKPAEVKPAEVKPAEVKLADSTAKDVPDDKSNVKKESNGVEKEKDDGKPTVGGVKGQFEKICRDYRRNICTRGDKCKFYHPPQPNASAAIRRRNSWLVLCHDFQNGQCTRSDCRYFHVTREDENVYHSTGDIHPLVVDQVMRKAYHLDIFRSGTRPPCREFLKGTCDLATCKYRHLNRREYEDEVFRALQDEFELVFGPPERRGTADVAPVDSYPPRNYQDPAWGYDRPPHDPYDSHPRDPGFPRPHRDYHDNIGPDDLRTTLLAHNEYEPDLKRRRRYSNEGYYSHHSAFEGDRRRWPEAMDYDRSYVGVDPAETERIMREMNSLRNENMELRREFEQQIITLKDQVNVLTDENASLRHENSVLRTSMSDADAVKKTAVDKLMLANDTLTKDNMQIKSTLLKLEDENLELKKRNDKRFDDLEKEKEEVKRSLARARELEQKAREELLKLRSEKEAQAKNAAKSESPKTPVKVDAAVKNDEVQRQDQNQNKNISSGRMGSSLRGFGTDPDHQRPNENTANRQEGHGADNRAPGMRGFNNDNKQSNWSNNAWNNPPQRPDMSKNAWGNQQQQSTNDKQSGPNWSNQQQQSQMKTEAQSLLGEYKPASLLGEYGPAAGRVLIGKRSADGAVKDNQNTRPKPVPQPPQLGGSLLGSNLKDNQPPPAAAALQGPNFTSNQPQSTSALRGPSYDSQSQPAGGLRGSNFKDNQPPPTSNLRGPNFGDNQPQSGGNFRGSNYDNQSQAAGNYRGSNYRDNQPPSASNLRGPNYSDNQSQGSGNYRGSNLNDNQSQGAGNYRGSNYNDNQSQGAGNYRGSNAGDTQSQGTGNYRGSNFGDSMSKGTENYRGSSFGDTQSQGAGNYRGSNFNDSQSQSAGNCRGSGYNDSQQSSASSLRGPSDSAMSGQYGASSMGSRYRFDDRDYGLRDNREYGLRSDRDYGLAGYDKDMGELRSSYNRSSDSRPPAPQSSQWGSGLRSSYKY